MERPTEAPPSRHPDHQHLTVVERPGRFVLLLDDEPVGHANFVTTDGVMTIPFVTTVPAHRGKDFAARLMSAVLDVARHRDLKIRPVCSYAASYMRSHPATHDLIA